MRLSMRDCATLRALARDWNESDHPRGQPENAGEFASVTEINIHPKQGAAKAETKGFKNWFGNSKVVDKAGKPLIVYHGTNKNFTEFDPSKTNDIGIHFGTKEQAEAALKPWGEMHEGSRIIPAYLSLQNPLRLPDRFSKLGTRFIANAKLFGLDIHLRMGNEDHDRLFAIAKEADKIRTKAGGDFSMGLIPANKPFAEKHTALSKEFWGLVTKIMKVNGYDGGVYSNKVEGAGDSYFVFDANQIKHAIGLSTQDHAFLRALARDDFDPNEPRVASGPKGGEWTTGGGAVSMKSDMPQHVQTSMKATVKPAATSGKLHSKMIATRYSVSKKNPVNAVTNQPDLASMKATPEAFEHNMKVFQSAKAYPNFREEDFNGKTPEQVAHMVVDHFKANIRYLYDHADEATKKGGMIWYQTAHKIATDFGKQYGVPEASSVAVVAALSPQKDWDQNIYLAQRVMSIANGQKNHAWDAGMNSAAKRIWKPKDQEIVNAIKGKTLGELTDPVEKGAWIRTYDEAHSNRQYGVFTGTGVGELATSKVTGKPKIAAWQALSAIANAVKCMDANDDASIISSSIGDNHKVRSFYNNILDPMSPNKDVTIDTHAVGCALMRSLSSASAPVLQNFGNGPMKENMSKAPGFMPVSNSKAGTGACGLYGIYAEAYRQAADEIGILPQQLQAIVWVQKRVLFEDLKDTQSAAVEGAWQTYHDGKATLQQTQDKVMEISHHG